MRPENSHSSESRRLQVFMYSQAEAVGEQLLPGRAEMRRENRRFHLIAPRREFDS
jgi:hypothetical protein